MAHFFVASFVCSCAVLQVQLSRKPHLRLKLHPNPEVLFNRKGYFKDRPWFWQQRKCLPSLVWPARLTIMKILRKVLPNGVRVIISPMSDAPTVTAAVYVATGSKNETKKLSGVSHFLEHLCFKGTKNRPQPVDISREMDELGALNNAYTDFECTSYYGKVAPRNLSKILEIIADLYLNPILPEVEVQKEKGVICDEINMRADMPKLRVEEDLMALLYGDQPAGRDIAGTKEGIMAMSRGEILAYRKSQYKARSTAVVIAGAIEPQKVFKMIEKLFAETPAGVAQKRIKVKDAQKSPAIFIRQQKTEQTHLRLAVRSFPLNDSRNYALAILSTVLGMGMSSRLFVKVRENLGLGYYVFAHNDALTDHGFFSAGTGVSSARVFEVIPAIISELSELAKSLVPAKELQKAKEVLISRMYMGLEGTHEVADYLGRREILGQELITPKELEKKLNQVSAEEIKKVARQIFIDKHLNLSLIGPYSKKDEPKFKRLLTFK